jgi:hypothetical protein
MPLRLLCSGLLLSTLSLNASGPHIYGRILGQDGQPLPDVTVILEDAHITKRTVTDDRGRFGLSTFLSGGVRVAFRKEGYQSASVEFLALPDTDYLIEPPGMLHEGPDVELVVTVVGSDGSRFGPASHAHPITIFRSEDLQHLPLP